MIRKTLFFLSSYIPLYLLLIGKNIVSKISEIDSFDFRNIVFFNEVSDFAIIILGSLSVALLIWLKFYIREGTKTNCFKVLDFNNDTDKYYYSYISIYLLPTIGLSISSYADIFVLVSLVIIIGYVYVSNDLVYINPVMGFMGYKVYTMELKSYLTSEVETKYVICSNSVSKMLVKGIDIDITSQNKYALVKKIS